MAAEALRAVLCRPDGSTYPRGYTPRAWLVAPTFKNADEVWLMPGGVLDLGREVIRDVNRAERRATVIGGGLIEVRTAEREENLRGGGLDFLGIDEAGQVPESAWRAMRPTLSDREGRAMFCGTPRGRNWWYREWLSGQPGPSRDADKESWVSPSNASPYFTQAEWESVKRDYPLDWFRQEYEAEFLTSQAAVFRCLDACLDASDGTPPSRVAKYVHGLDIAKTVDWSVLTTVDVGTSRVVAIKRLQRVEYQVQADIFAAQIRAYPGEVWADSTGVGPALIDPLQARGPVVHGYQFTEESKRRLVGNLITGIESKTIRIPTGGDFATLVRELRDFEYKLTGTGQPRYGAPDGLHDDCVYSLALAWWGLCRGAAAFAYEPNFRKRSA